VTVKGPYVFNINSLDMLFKHAVYLRDSTTPFTAGFDFVVRAGPVIDSVNLPGGRAERYSFVNQRTKNGMDERDSSKNPAF